MPDFILGIVVGVLINLATALFSRHKALALMPWLFFYIILHGAYVLFTSDAMRGFVMKNNHWWTYMVVAILAVGFWKFITVSVKRIDRATSTLEHADTDRKHPTANDIADEVIKRLQQQKDTGSRNIRPAAEANTVASLGLFPSLNEGAKNTNVDAMALAFQNNGTVPDHNISTKLFLYNVAKEIKVVNPNRVKVTDGGVRANFINLFVPELLPGELQVVSIGLAFPITGYKDADLFGKKELRAPKFWSNGKGESPIIVYLTT